MLWPSSCWKLPLPHLQRDENPSGPEQTELGFFSQLLLFIILVWMYPCSALAGQHLKLLVTLFAPLAVYRPLHWGARRKTSEAKKKEVLSMQHTGYCKRNYDCSTCLTLARIPKLVCAWVNRELFQGSHPLT